MTSSRIAALAGLPLIALLALGARSAPPAPAGAGGPPPDSILRLADAGRIQGSPSARVWLVEASDFQCPFCKAFETGGVSGIPTAAAFPDIVKNYVDTGKVKVVFMDFPFLGNDSVTAAEYGRAIWKHYPDQYFAWRTAMYKAQDQEGDVGFGNAASIDTLDATISGIDAAKVKADVAANAAAYDAAANADKAEGQKFGINATPSFIIGTQVIAGAQGYDAFKAAIDAELAK